jgi:hypothetical protein
MTNKSDKPENSEPQDKSAPDVESPHEEHEESENNKNSENIESHEQDEEVWPQIRQLLIFQVKLYVDALRDLLMSPLSIIILVIDLIQKNQGDKALFNSLLEFGRKTEKAINLFNQYDHHNENLTGIDAIVSQVEESVRKEYKDGTVSNKAKETIDKSLQNLRERIKRAREDDKTEE